MARIRTQIQVRNPFKRSFHGRGGYEHWTVTVTEDRIASGTRVFAVTCVCDHIEIPEEPKFGLPAETRTLPGHQLEPQTNIKSLAAARKNAFWKADLLHSGLNPEWTRKDFP